MTFSITGFLILLLVAISIEHHPFPVIWSIIGAALFVAIVHLISGRR